MPGRDEGTGALIEPSNIQKPASWWPCCHDQASLTVNHPMVGETEPASHTEFRTLPVCFRQRETCILVMPVEASASALLCVSSTQQRNTNCYLAASIASPSLPNLFIPPCDELDLIFDLSVYSLFADRPVFNPGGEVNDRIGFGLVLFGQSRAEWRARTAPPDGIE